MKLLTEAQRAQLLDNARASLDLPNAKKWQPTVILYNDMTDEVQLIDHLPVVRLYSPDTGDWWVLTEMNPDNPDRVCGVSGPDGHLGFFGLAHIAKLYDLVRDRHFQPDKRISEYAEQVLDKAREEMDASADIYIRTAAVMQTVIANYLKDATETEFEEPVSIKLAADTIIQAAKMEAERYGEEPAFTAAWAAWQSYDAYGITVQIERLIRALNSRLRRGLKLDALEAMDNARTKAVAGEWTPADYSAHFGKDLRSFVLDFVKDAGLFTDEERDRFVAAAPPGMFQWGVKDRPEQSVLEFISKIPIGDVPDAINRLMRRNLESVCQEAGISLPSKALDEVIATAIVDVMDRLRRMAMEKLVRKSA